MAPTSTTITEIQQTRLEPVRSISLPSKNGKPFLEKPMEEKRSIFHPKIGNGMPLKWFNIIVIFALHFYTAYLICTQFVYFKWSTILFFLAMGAVTAFGVTGGVHRFWTHRTFKAKLPLRIILMCCFSTSGQNTIFDWVRDHRVHHKFSDTEADPHNANLGFFFSHCGWLMQNKHPEVIRKGNMIDMSDVLADPVVQFSQKNFALLKLFWCFVFPTVLPPYLFGETWFNSFAANIIRYCLSLNFTWSVNSAAHIWGYKPYDNRIKPAENPIVSFVAFGEGWHNYHHVFPWDYKAAELGSYYLNVTTMLLDMFAKIGWAYDLKQPSKELVQRVLLRNQTLDHPEEVLEEEELVVLKENGKTLKSS